MAPEPRCAKCSTISSPLVGAHRLLVRDSATGPSLDHLDLGGPRGLEVFLKTTVGAQYYATYSKYARQVCEGWLVLSLLVETAWPRFFLNEDYVGSLAANTLRSYAIWLRHKLRETALHLP